MIVDIDEELYQQVTKLVEQDKVEYANIKNFVNKAVREKINLETQNKYQNEVKK